MYCSEVIFEESYLPSDSRTNTVNLRPICQSTQNSMHGAIFLYIADCNLEVLVFVEGGKQEENPWSKKANQQQTQPT